MNSTKNFLQDILVTKKVINKLNREATSNPLKNLKKDNPLKKSNYSSTIVSIATSVIAVLGLIGGLLSLYYVISKISSFSSTESTGIEILKQSLSITKTNTHYVCIPGNTNMIVTLIDPNLCYVNDYISVSLPIALSDSVDLRSLSVTWTNDDGPKSFPLSPNSGALFVVSNELQKNRWKLVRQWT